MATTFSWGGLTWGFGDLAAFTAYLKQHGVAYESWAANHPDAASLLEESPQTYFQTSGYNEGAAGLPTGTVATPPPYTPGEPTPTPPPEQAPPPPPPTDATPATLTPPPSTATAAGGGLGTAYDDPNLGLSDDQVQYELMAEYSGEVNQPAVQVPATAWQSLRDTLVYDLPFVGSHVRARGRGLSSPLASDLWSSST